ncbi:MAG: phospho-N-acetylmuramoyl-pentapeptide-transferase [Clostridia bacterium]|nr:phospho-N-acetylmuramoyl-pentapeptide-transferase [Clostridia bacterium]
MNMFRLCLSLVLSWAMVLLMGKHVVNALHKLHFGQTIYELGPQSHMKKQGTPVMGGLMFAASTVVCTIVGHQGAFQGICDFSIALILCALLSMAVGFGDDYIKAVKKRHEGLTPKQKILGQCLVGLLFSVYCYVHPQVGSKIMIPFTSATLDLGIFYIPVMFLLIIFMVNSSNLQDGLDGLLSSVSAVGAAGFAVIAFILAYAATGDARSNLLTLAAFALALCGGVAGFLRFNRFPAQTFMGDTGSMFIGGAMVSLAMLMRQPLLLLLICFTPIMSSMSVIIQRTYFKITHGKRIFRMSPIHHHFELKGYKETQIVSMYACMTGVLTMVAVLSVLGNLAW